jgi:membrane-anchored protein YejM (alkaline phosphatase superfamily)
LAIEAMLAAWVWTRTARAPRRRIGWYVALGLATCLVTSHLIQWWAEAHYYVPVTAFTRYLPLYFPYRDAGQLARLGLLDRNQAREQGLVAALRRPPDGVLNYPLAPLRCEPRLPRLNVLLVVIDAMRADALRPGVAPRMDALAQDAIRFDAHYSGGNSSRAGMFSLFYGLPATYWDTFADFARPPVLMDLFRQYGYQFGLFASAPLYRWFVGLDRTALARIPNLRLETNSLYPGSSGWDRTVTEEWLQWLEKRDPSRPFFGFLYYDAVVSLDAPATYPPVAPVPPGAPTQVRRSAQYLTAVHYDDSLIRQVLDDLNPPSDYASGHSLFSDAQWNWLIAASYADFALIEPDRVTVVFPSGYEIRDRNYRLLPNPTLPRDGLRAAMHEMGRFYR